MTVDLTAVTKDNVDDVKIILSSVLPVAYPASFYKQLGKQRSLTFPNVRLVKVKRSSLGTWLGRQRRRWAASSGNP